MRLFVLALALCAPAAPVFGQSCASSSYGGSAYRFYAAPTYSYAAPAYKVTQYKEVYKEPVVYKNDAYFVRLVAFFPVLDVPTYGAAVYAPPPAGVAAGVQAPAATAAQASPAATQQAQSDTKAIMDFLKVLDARLARLEQSPRPQGQVQPKQAAPEQGPQPKQEDGLTALVIVKNKCAACHNSAEAAEVGGSLVLITDGALEKLSARQSAKVIRESYNAKMPPKKGRKGETLAPLTDGEVAVLLQHYTGGASAEPGANEIAAVAEAKPKPKPRPRPKLKD